MLLLLLPSALWGMWHFFFFFNISWPHENFHMWVVKGWSLQYYNFCLKPGMFWWNLTFTSNPPFFYFTPNWHFPLPATFSKFFAMNSMLLNICLFTSIQWWATEETKPKPTLFSCLLNAQNGPNLYILWHFFYLSQIEMLEVNAPRSIADYR